MKRFIDVLLLLVITSLLLSACQSLGSSGGTIKIVSDLPRTGSAKGQSDTMVNALNMFLEEKESKVCDGAWTVEYEDVDGASAALGKWDPEVETANAKRYAEDTNIVAVIGTYNSGAAKLMIPIFNPVELVMISPANTYPGLTLEVAGVTEAGEPTVLYPNGKRNYARVVAPDHIQGAAGADWAQSLGAQSIYVLDDQETYGKGVAQVFALHAKEIGLDVLGQEGIDAKAADYKALATKIIGLNPDLVYLGMITQNNAGQVIKDLRGQGYEGLIMGPDGTFEQALVDAAGDSAEGYYVTFAGVPADKMEGDAAAWRDAYVAKFNGQPEAYAVYTYVSMQVLWSAMEKLCADGVPLTDRAALREAVMTSSNVPSVLGNVTFDANGDPTTATMTGSQVIGGKFEFVSFLGQ